MKIDVEFNSTNQRMDANFGQNGNDMDVRFDQIHTLNGKDGLSAYEIAVRNGFEGTEPEWIASLKGRDGYTPVKGKDYFDGEDGYTPVKDKDYFDGEDGYTPVKGKDYFDGEDGFSPVVSVEDIDGGHRVTITDKDGNKTFDVMDGEGGTGGGGASPAIVDVAMLPETDIREDVFYRSFAATFYLNNEPQPSYKAYVVDTLPEVGEPATDASMLSITAYYAADTETVSGYLPDMLAGVFGIPAGWYPADMLFQVAGVVYGGIVNSVDEMETLDTLYLLLHNNVKYRNDNEWNDLSSVGWYGTTMGAEKFNSKENIAEGFFSHAEGYYSHAEGYGSHAEGNCSHAEGDCSHAEGDSSHAEGGCSHAEGIFSHAEGYGSHAEGYGTHATGESQHVQGKYNEIDPEYDPENPYMHGKYIHIVGNGDNNLNRSNAHTLDWDGNAWYQGTVESAGIVLTAPNGKKYKFTVNNDGVLIGTKI